MALANGATSRPQLNLGAGVIGGLAAGVVGAIVWALVGALTHHSWSLIAVGVGYGVAFGVTKAGRGGGVEFGVTAAIITVLSGIGGFLANFYLDVSGLAHRSVGTVMDVYGPTWVISHMIQHAPLTIVFILLGAFYAFRAAASGTTSLRGVRSTTGAPATYGQQPSYGPPAYGQQPSYGPPAYGQPQAPQQHVPEPQAYSAPPAQPDPS